MSDERIWKALADGTRREILDLLRVRARTTGELAEQFEMSRYGVMKHLAVLVEANLVLVRRRGRQRWNHLNVVPLQEAIDRWAGRYQRVAASSLLRLRDLSEQQVEGLTMANETTEQAGIAPRTIQVELEVRIAAAPARVYEVMTTRIAEWWVDPYRLLESSDLTIELELGGKVYEQAGKRLAMWGTVTGIEPDRHLEMTGPFGMGGATYGVAQFDLEPDGDGTLLKLSHHATGEVDESTQSSYQHGWGELLRDNLVRLVEAG